MNYLVIALMNAMSDSEGEFKGPNLLTCVNIVLGLILFTIFGLVYL